jgi:ankyrin repeat protein
MTYKYRPCDFTRYGAYEELETCPGDVNVPDEDGQTPLYCATSDNRLDYVKYLIEQRGANVEERNQGGWAPLHVAAWYGHLDCLIYLVQKGADVNAPIDLYSSPELSRTALTLAASKGHVECAKHLIEKGALVNASQGASFLDAILNSDANMIALLLSNGADPFEVVDNIEYDELSYIVTLKVPHDYNKRRLQREGYLVVIAMRTFKERQAIQAMMSMKTHKRLGRNSPLKMLPTELIHHLHSYFV